MAQAQKRVWGWYFFDWASQPFNTLLLTFIFGPYVVSVMGDGSAAQTVWGYGIGLAGVFIALLAPMLGAVADKAGGRMRFIALFSVLYVIGSAMLWFSAPADFNVWFVMIFFCIGLIGMEFTTIFTDSMLPDIAKDTNVGLVSGGGWAFGYLGGILSLIVMLALFAEGSSGTTLIGIAPIFSLDPETREGTRAVGPITTIWYILFMIPFFLWVKEPPKSGAIPLSAALKGAFPELRRTLKSLPTEKSLTRFLIGSMFYRDALNGMFAFGGIYAAGVLGWSVTQVGIFGISAALMGAIFAWLGGRADQRFGPKPVIMAAVVALTIVAFAVIFVDRDSVFGIAVGAQSSVPDIAFLILGSLIGAGGGAMQAASRSLLVNQIDPEKVVQSFGLYALAGKATSFIAPLSIGVVTGLTGSQQLGVAPVAALFLIGLAFLWQVEPKK